MIFASRYHRSRNLLEFLPFFVFLLSIFVFPSASSFAQSGTNATGNGGKHIIQGRVYIASGRRASMPDLKVRLESMGLGDITVFLDANGSFAFRNISPGSYMVVIDGTDAFETVRESVYIDDPGASSLSGGVNLRSTPRTMNVQIHLQPKRIETLRNEVLNVKWSMIPREAVQHFKRGLDLLQTGKETEAEAAFRSSVAIAPNFAPAHTAIGTLELRMRKFENAVESFKNAIRYDAADFDANLNLGIAYFNLNKLDEAEPPLVNAAYLDRFAMKPHYYLGLIFSVKNNGEVAQKAFEKAKELDGGRSFPIIHKYLARIYMHKQMNKQAVAEFETYLKLLPSAKDAEAVRKDIAEIKSRQDKAN